MPNRFPLEYEIHESLRSKTQVSVNGIQYEFAVQDSDTSLTKTKIPRCSLHVINRKAGGINLGRLLSGGQNMISNPFLL